MRTIKDINNLRCLEDLAAMIWVKCCEGGKFDGTKCADVLREWQEWRFKGTVTFTAHPIETAPKDRFGFMIYCPKTGWHKGFFNVHHGWCTYRGDPRYSMDIVLNDDQPTHWAELEDMAPKAAVPKEGEE